MRHDAESTGLAPGGPAPGWSGGEAQREGAGSSCQPKYRPPAFTARYARFRGRKSRTPGAVEPHQHAEASDAFREGLHLRGIPLHEVPQDGIHPAEELRVKAHSRRGDVVPELLRP